MRCHLCPIIGFRHAYPIPASSKIPSEFPHSLYICMIYISKSIKGVYTSPSLCNSRDRRITCSLVALFVSYCIVCHPFVSCFSVRYSRNQIAKSFIFQSL